MEPLVTIVIPTFNRADMIGEAIDSALDQTYQNIEIIIVDDGSTDNTEALVREKYSNNARIRYAKQPNAGASVARNHGAKLAKGTYISFLDSDDKYLPFCIQDKVNLSLTTDSGTILGGCIYFDNTGTPPIKPTPPRIKTTYQDLCIFTFCPGGTNNIFVKRQLFQDVGGFREDLADSEDRDLLRRLARIANIASVQKTTVAVRIHSGERVGRNLKKSANDRYSISKNIPERWLRTKSMAWNAMAIGNLAWGERRFALAFVLWVKSFAIYPFSLHPELQRLRPIIRRLLGRE